MSHEFEDYSKFCIISGKPELAEFLLNNGCPSNDLFDLLTEPLIWEQVWQKPKGVFHKRHANEDAAIARIKLSFLFSLWNDYILGNDEYVAESVRRLLGENPIHYSVFDKWWILSRPMHENSREIEKSLSLKTVAAFDKTGFPETDEWLENLIPKP